jgi:hypothetical protein
VQAKVRIIYDHWIPRKLGVTGITLYPFIFFDAPADKIPASTLHHEMIHVEQIGRHGFIKFYVLYLWQYATALWATRQQRHTSWKSWNDAAYRSIAFEAEAYARENEKKSNEEIT